ncbi:MAG: heat shock protein DnaJ domain protein, partial [Polaromonas sp.]|nr:heat shock protein DnaJ domain protein [Polaromonas sp.]
MAPDRQHPLTWPPGWKRTRSPGASKFKTDPDKATRGLLAEIERLGGREVIISSNAQYRQDGMPYARQGYIGDTGVAVYFKRKGKPQVFACDTFWRIHENIHAIAKTIEALRAIERYGASDMMERAFTGFTALPAP